jgi:hypothetical protein
VLKQAGFPLNYNTYYNIYRRRIFISSNEFNGFIITLKEAGFVFKC